MRIKIISPGKTIQEAKVINAETGEMIDGVIKAEIMLDASTGKQEAVIWIRNPLVEFEAEMQVRCWTTGEDVLEKDIKYFKI